MSEEQGQLEFSEKDINAIYTELADLFVPLDSDPVAFGPKRLNHKTSEVRRMLDRVHRIYLGLSQRLGAGKRSLRKLETGLDLEKKHLFANDPETRSGRNVADREAIAVGKLRAKVEELNNFQILVSDLEAILAVVKAKHADLRDTEGRLRDQIRLCGEELSLNGKWGSALPNSPSLDLRAATGADVKEIDDLLAGLSSQIDLAQQAGDFPVSHMKAMTADKAKDAVEVLLDNPFASMVAASMRSPDEPKPVMVSIEPEVQIDPPAEIVSETPSDILENILAVNLAEALPAQSSPDDFLEKTIVSSFTKPQASKVVEPVDNCAGIEDLLSSFENVNG